MKNNQFFFCPLNLPPFADFTWAPEEPIPYQVITFDSSDSIDYDGYITLYEWDWNNDGAYEESHTTSTLIYSWDNPGCYRVTLRVTDNASLTENKSQTIIIIENPPPNLPTIIGPDWGLSMSNISSVST